MTTITDEIDMQALERAENVSLETLLNYDPVRFNERILFVWHCRIILDGVPCFWPLQWWCWAAPLSSINCNTINLRQDAPNVGCDLALFGKLDHVHRLIDRQGMSSFVLPPIPYGLFKKNSRLPSAASGIEQRPRWLLGRGSWPFAIAGTNNVVESETHAMMVATPKVSIGVTADVVDREPEIRLGNVAETGIDTHQSGIRWPTNYVT